MAPAERGRRDLSWRPRAAVPPMVVAHLTGAPAIVVVGQPSQPAADLQKWPARGEGGQPGCLPLVSGREWPPPPLAHKGRRPVVGSFAPTTGRDGDKNTAQPKHRAPHLARPGGRAGVEALMAPPPPLPRRRRRRLATLGLQNSSRRESGSADDGARARIGWRGADERAVGFPNALIGSLTGPKWARLFITRSGRRAEWPRRQAD